MALLSTGELEDRARALVTGAKVGEVAAMASVPGGGTLPGAEIDSFGVMLGRRSLGSVANRNTADHRPSERRPYLARPQDRGPRR